MAEHGGGGYPPVDLSAEALDTLLRAAFPARRTLAAEPLTGGFANTIYHITTDDRASYVARFYSRSPPIAATEVALLRFLQSRVPVPEVVFADTEGALVGYPVSVTRFVEGVLLDRVLAGGSAAEAEDAGEAVDETLAGIGAVTFSGAGFFGSDLQPHPLSGTFAATLRSFFWRRLFDGSAGTALGVEGRDRLWAMVDRAVPLLDAVGDTNHLVHSDFNGKNILMSQVSGRWRVAAVLDWEFAFAGTALFDIGNMLRFSHLMPASYEPAFIRGFRHGGGVLPDNWQTLARLIDLSALVDFLGREEGHAFFGPARDLILSTIAQGEI